MPELRLTLIPRRARNGFSLVELLVALVFMALLMAGMAKVYQSSMNTFYKSSESLSSGRRNRMAMDLLYDDLNAAGQYLVNLTAYPTFSAGNPGFYILPNQAYTGTDVPAAKALTDQLSFYYDEALPFEGRLVDSSAGGTAAFALTSNADLVSNQADVNKVDKTIVVNFQDPSYANMVGTYAANKGVGLVAVFKDQWGPMSVGAVTVNGNQVSFTPNAAPDNEKGLPTGVNPLNKDRHFAGDGSFPSGLPPTINITPTKVGGAPVLFVHPAQMVRYLIKSMALDPANPAVGVPCLVRQQGDYATGGFVSSQETVIAEDVTGFKVYLSAYPDPAGDPAKTWAGWKLAANDFDSGWTNGILASINTQLTTLGLTSSPNTSDPNWFRNTPLIVRVDLTTRTAIKRAENTATGTTADYQERTQTLYMVPRHFGLSFQ